MIFDFGSYEKEGGTRFVLLLQSRITIGRFMKTYLHTRIEILHFLSVGDF